MNSTHCVSSHYDHTLNTHNFPNEHKTKQYNIQNGFSFVFCCFLSSQLQHTSKTQAIHFRVNLRVNLQGDPKRGRFAFKSVFYLIRSLSQPHSQFIGKTFSRVCVSFGPEMDFLEANRKMRVTWRVIQEIGTSCVGSKSK